jgi:IS1 family transposase
MTKKRRRYLWRAVDHEGEVLEAVVTARRDKAAALKLLKRIMKKYGRPQSIVTDRLRSYSGAMKEIVAADRHEVGGRLNNRAENSHQPFRRRERAMLRFRSMKTLQKFSSVHAQVQNHFNQERHLVTRQDYKQRRSIALAEWRAFAASGLEDNFPCRRSEYNLLSQRPAPKALLHSLYALPIYCLRSRQRRIDCHGAFPAASALIGEIIRPTEEQALPIR